MALPVQNPHPDLLVRAEECDKRADAEQNETGVDHPDAGVLRHLESGVPRAPVIVIPDGVVFGHSGLSGIRLHHVRLVEQRFAFVNLELHRGVDKLLGAQEPHLSRGRVPVPERGHADRLDRPVDGAHVRRRAGVQDHQFARRCLILGPDGQHDLAGGAGDHAVARLVERNTAVRERIIHDDAPLVDDRPPLEVEHAEDTVVLFRHARGYSLVLIIIDLEIVAPDDKPEGHGRHADPGVSDHLLLSDSEGGRDLVPHGFISEKDLIRGLPLRPGSESP